MNVLEQLQSYKASTEKVYFFRRDTLINELHAARENRGVDPAGWDRTHHRVRMQLNLLEFDVAPVLAQIDVMLHLETLISTCAITTKDVVDGIRGYENDLGCKSTADTNAGYVLSKLKGCGMNTATPGFQEWKNDVHARNTTSEGSIIIFVGELIASSPDASACEDVVGSPISKDWNTLNMV